MEIKILNEQNIVKISNFLVGSDPEFFLEDVNTKETISAEGLIGGSKKNPKIIKEGFAMQEDGVLLEVNVPPVNNHKDFSKNIDWLLNHIQKNVLPENLKIVCKASSYLDSRFLQSEQATVFGCSPDYNCWDTDENEAPNASGICYRSAGGHFACSYDNMNKETSLTLLRNMELFMAVPSVILDKDTLRKTLYGKSGAYRMNNVFFEFRTLSNFWLQSPEYIEWAFENFNQCVEATNNGFRITDNLYDCEAIVMAVNNNDKQIAQYLIDKYSINMDVQEAINTEKVNQ